MTRTSKRILLLLPAAAILAALLLFLLVWNGVLLPNGTAAEKYPVRGVDVSHYQGKIDWQTLAAQKISFAFIKATEGSGYQDPEFAYNYSEAQKTALRVGAYHFFSFDSEGETQAENFISTVTACPGMLPPVVDFEFYGDKEKNPPDAGKVREQLYVLLSRLEEHYGIKPLLYATEKAYSMYLSGEFEGYEIWIRNVFTKPRLGDGREWSFWQYTDRAVLKGYAGEEKFIDLNVFSGNAAEFAEYGKQK